MAQCHVTLLAELGFSSFNMLREHCHFDLTSNTVEECCVPITALYNMINRQLKYWFFELYMLSSEY